MPEFAGGGVVCADAGLGASAVTLVNRTAARSGVRKIMIFTSIINGALALIYDLRVGRSKRA
jgi:hypothetical protein